MTVSAMMMQKFTVLASVPDSDSFAKVADKIARNGLGAVVVLGQAGQLAGMVTEADMVKAYSRHHGRVEALTAADIMTADVHTCRSDETELEIMTVMVERRIRHMPVMLGESVVGLVTLDEAVRLRLQKVRELNERMAGEPSAGKRQAMVERHMKQSWSIFELFRAVNGVQEEAGLAALDERSRHLLWLIGAGESAGTPLRLRDLMAGHRWGSYPTVRRYLDELLNAELIQHAPSDDGRGKPFALSPRGRQVFARMTAAVADAILDPPATTAS